MLNDQTTNDIIDALSSLEELCTVEYGGIPANFRPEYYNYAIVMQAKPIVTNGAWKDRWRIAIVMEDAIPADYIRNKVIPALKSVKGIKVEYDSFEDPDYIVMANTQMKLQLDVFYICKSERYC